MLAHQALVDALTSTDQQKFYNARQSITALGESAVPDLIQALTRTASDRDRWRILLTLAQIGGSRTVTTMIGQLHSPSSAIRAVAAQFLGQAGDKRALKPMLDLLADPMQVGSLLWVLTALGNLGERQAVDPIITYLHTTPSAPEKCAAIMALGALGDAKATAHIQQFSQDSDHHVRDKVKLALEQLTGQPQ